MTQINLLVTHNELDKAGYYMLEQLSYRPGIKVYITATTEGHLIKGNCIPVAIPPLTSKIAFKAIKVLRKFIKENDINIIYSPSTRGLSNALFASLGTKAKNIAYKGTQAKFNLTDITYYLGILNPRVKHVICVTQDIKEYSSRFFREDQLSVIPKPFDVSWVENAIQNPETVEGIPEGAFRCLNIASNKKRPFKGLSYLIEAFYLVDDPRLHLILVGDYDDSHYQLAKKGVDEGRIHFLGYRTNAINFIPGQDLFVLPSLRDAAPRVVKESMACGLPCIVTDIPGARDLIIDGVTGFLVPPASPEKLAEAIKVMMNDEKKRDEFGKAGREHIINNFPTEKYTEAFEEVIKQYVQ